jgi:excisionase family DNA binding protein
VSPVERDALRVVATSLPAGTAIPVTREHLLTLLGDAPVVKEEKAAPLLTVAEVAQRLKVDKQTVYKQQKQLGAQKVGRAIRIPESGVARYLARSRRGS